MTDPRIPVAQFVGNGDTLFQWLGTLWTALYEDSPYLRRCQGAKALAETQTHLDALECYALNGRHTVPVHHRRRWYPVTVRLSERDTGPAAALKLGMTPAPVLGRQPRGSAYPVGLEFKLGGSVTYADVVTYPAPLDLKGAAVAVDNIATPKVMLVRDKDFTIVDGTIVLRRDRDPFVDPDFVQTPGQGEDVEAVLWFTDAMIDRGHVQDYLGSVFGIAAASTDYDKAVLNAAWDMLTDGPTLNRVTAAVCALFGVPVTAGVETVDEILTQAGTTVIATDANVYTVPGNAVLNPIVVAGAVLPAATPLTMAVHIYTRLHDPTSAWTREHYPELRQDIPAVTLPKSFFAADLEHGFAVNWELVPIYYAGDDANGNPRLWFPMEGTAADLARFWQEVWNRCEAAKVSLRTCFAGHIDATVTSRPGQVWGYIEPLDFMLRNLIAANSVFVAVDVEQLAPGMRGRVTPALLSLITEALPASTRLFLVEHRQAPEETLALDAVPDTSTLYTSLSRASVVKNGKPGRDLTFSDAVLSRRWVATCKE